ncbi:hypothetical protein Fmac_012574 [Flemingia macrophylla]|uniref:Uncharacterized protein n=1 Tax=Flemingia macrophylla TaxID=520843 RepID=A0ABD1MQN7_9FABA
MSPEAFIPMEYNGMTQVALKILGKEDIKKFFVKLLLQHFQEENDVKKTSPRFQDGIKTYSDSPIIEEVANVVPFSEQLERTSYSLFESSSGASAPKEVEVWRPSSKKNHVLTPRHQQQRCLSPNQPNPEIYPTQTSSGPTRTNSMVFGLGIGKEITSHLNS